MPVGRHGGRTRCVCDWRFFHWGPRRRARLPPGPATHPRVEAVGVLVAGVLPGLGEHAVVPVDVVGVEPDLALLGVLLDGVAHLVGGQLHLGGRLLGDLAHEVEEAVAQVEGDVVPGGHGGALLLHPDAVLQSLGGALQAAGGRAGAAAAGQCASAAPKLEELGEASQRGVAQAVCVAGAPTRLGHQGVLGLGGHRCEGHRARGAGGARLHGSSTSTCQHVISWGLQLQHRGTSGSDGADPRCTHQHSPGRQSAQQRGAHHESRHRRAL
jgi:hypothetical protein